MPTSLFIKNLSLSYAERVIFSSFHLTIPAGKWIALLGPSGIGKSSLLRLVAGLQKNDTGEIKTDHPAPLHQQIAYMAQTDLLLPWMNVLNNVLLGHHLRHQKNKTATEKAIFLLDEMGLSDAIHLYPHELSGGMRQRVALARTLMEDKPIVLMDEPFSALDAITRYKLQNLASTLLKNKTVFFITHDPSEALRLAHEIYIMQGQPVVLKQAASLSLPAPRDLNQSDLMTLQSKLFQLLSEDNPA